LKMKNRFSVSILLVCLLTLGMVFVGCDNGGDDDKSQWWTWNSTMKDGSYDTTAQVSITPTSDDTGCDVVVTGSPNISNYNWASQLGIDYTAIVGKTYKVTWKWQANNKSFNNVTVRYAQRKDYMNDGDYEPSDFRGLSIPTTEETKTLTFTMPDNCFSNFTFMIGEDTGSFQIRNFKIEEIQ